MKYLRARKIMTLREAIKFNIHNNVNISSAVKNKNYSSSNAGWQFSVAIKFDRFKIALSLKTATFVSISSHFQKSKQSQAMES